MKCQAYFKSIDSLRQELQDVKRELVEIKVKEDKEEKAGFLVGISGKAEEIIT